MNVTRGSIGVLVVAMMAASSPAGGETVGTAFTYQGQLLDDGVPVNDTCDFEFACYDAASGGNQVGPTVTSNGVPVGSGPGVGNGLFTVTVDFGSGVFEGQARWLEVAVQCPGDPDFTPLSPRQPVPAVPYALYALDGPGGGASFWEQNGSDIYYNDGYVGIGTTTPGERLDVAGNIQAGGTVRSGDSITIDGASDPPTISSTNGVALEVHVNNQRTLRIEPVVETIYEDEWGGKWWKSVNVIGGHYLNSTSNGITGATIGGGGLVIREEDEGEWVEIFPNRVTASLGTVSGGAGNTAGWLSTVGGGAENLAGLASLGYLDTVGGGGGNTASGGLSTVGGGGGNTASGPGSTIGGGGGGGGGGNTASGWWSTVPGGEDNTAGGDHSFAAGYRAKVRDVSQTGEDPEDCPHWYPEGCGDEGTFVWADSSTDYDFESTGPNQFLIRATGGVGIGTNDPQEDLDVVGNLAARNATDTKMLRLRTSGTALDFDFHEANLYVSSEAGVAMVIDHATRNVGIGTTTPSSKLEVQGSDPYLTLNTTNVQTGLQFQQNGATKWGLGWNSGSQYLYFWRASGGTSVVLSDSTGNVGIGRGAVANKLEVEGNASKTTAGDWLANSDRRIKTDLAPITDALDKLDKVRLVGFRYTDEYRAEHPDIADRRYVNVVAQEFQQVFPDYVQDGGDRLPDGEPILQVDPYPLTIYSAAAVQELHAMVKAKDAEIEALRAERDAEIAELRTRLARLESLMFDSHNAREGGAQ